MADFPITMAGREPMVEARFGDKTARFILDSGAFYSTISRASATEFGLKVTPTPPWFRLKGIGGDTSAGIATADKFSERHAHRLVTDGIGYNLRSEAPRAIADAMLQVAGLAA